MAYNTYFRQIEDDSEEWPSSSEYEKQPESSSFYGAYHNDKFNSFRSASDSLDQGDWDYDEEHSPSDPFSANSTMDCRLINDRELSVKKLNIDQKRFFIALRENDFGRFIRIVETTKKFSKNRVIIPEGLLKEFLEIIDNFSYHNQEKRIYSDPSYGTFSDILVRKTLKQHSKSIFLELRENKMGRFLKVISLLRHDRQHIIMPAAGISALYSVVEMMMQESEQIDRPNLWEDDSGNCIETPVVSEKNHDTTCHDKPASIAKICIDSHLYFDVLLATGQEINLKITDSAADTSLQIAHKNWAACINALQMLVEKYPAPVNNDT